MRHAPLHIVLALTLAADCARAQQVVRVIATPQADVLALDDGWVEVVAPFPFTGSVERQRVRERYRPADVSRWLAETRAVLALPAAARPARMPVLGGAGGILIQLALPPGGDFPAWTPVASGCNRGLFAAPGRAAGQVSLYEALDSAAMIARTARAEPLPIDPMAVYSAAQLACPASGLSALLPFDPAPPPIGRKSAPREAIAWFVITPTGRVDTSTVEFTPGTPPELVHAARVAMAAWTYTQPRLGGVAVHQQAAASIMFVDGRDVTSRIAAGMEARREWYVRSDGLIGYSAPAGFSGPAPVRFGGPGLVQEAYTPTVLEAWLLALERARLAASRDSGRMRATTQPGNGTRILDPAWTATLGGPLGATRQVTYYRQQDAGNTRIGASETVVGCERPGTMYSNTTDSSVSATMIRVAAVLAEARQAPPMLVATDSMRVYGATEVACHSRPRDLVRPVLDHMLDSALALSSEAAASLVVGRDGRVETGSIHVFGDWSDAERQRIIAANRRDPIRSRIARRKDGTRANALRDSSCQGHCSRR